MLNPDALLPPEMAQKAEKVGASKAAMDAVPMFFLAVLAGAFIALGALFATVVTAGASGILPYGVTRLLAGVAFSLGLILVVVGGAELFTGNTMIALAWAGGKVRWTALLRNWIIVYTGNFVGALGTALLVFLGKQYTFGAGAVGKGALSTAALKCDLDFVQAVALGILCNGLVCLAVWLTYSARSTTDKIMSIIFPVSAFVAAGFEHSIANMYFIPMGLFIKNFDSSWAKHTEVNLTALNWENFLLRNLLPVTIGNIIGGAVLVALMYWFIYMRSLPEKPDR